MSEPERYVSGPDDRLFAAGEKHVVAKSVEQATEFLGEPAVDVTDTVDGITREWWTTWRQLTRSAAEGTFHGPPCGVDQTKPDVDVCKDVRGVWWVTLDGVKVSDHRTHDAARIAARRHQVELMSK